MTTLKLPVALWGLIVGLLAGISISAIASAKVLPIIAMSVLGFFAGLSLDGTRSVRERRIGAATAFVIVATGAVLLYLLA